MTKRYFKSTDGTLTIFRATTNPKGFRFGRLLTLTVNRAGEPVAPYPSYGLGFCNTMQPGAYHAVEIAKAEYEALVALKKARVIAAGRDNVRDSSPSDAWVSNAAIEGAAA